MFSKYSLDKDSPIPLYFQLKKIILEQIESGKLKTDENIPTESEFIDIFDISRTTVRQAIMELVNEGFLYRAKGKGTFVAKPKLEQDFMQKLESFDEQMIRLNITPSTKVLTLGEVNPPQNVKQAFKLGDNDKTLFLERIRYANDLPIVVVKTYLPLFCREFLDKNLERDGLYNQLSKNPRTTVIRVRRQLEAILSSDYEEKLLGLNSVSAIQLSITNGFNNNDELIEYSVAYYRGDKNQFVVDLVV